MTFVNPALCNRALIKLPRLTPVSEVVVKILTSIAAQPEGKPFTIACAFAKSGVAP
jgi:hypothetical protein